MIREDLPERLHNPGLWGGTIAESALDLTTPVEVLIPQFDLFLRWGPCYWMPRYYQDTVDVAESSEGSHMIDTLIALFPSRGDKCLIAFDNIKQPWIVVWWPYE